MVDPLLLADAQRSVLDALAADEAEEARLFARRVRHLAAAVEMFERSAGVEHFLTIELAGTCRIGQVRGANRIDEAVRLTGVFLPALELLERGELFVHTAQLLLSLTKACTEQVQTRVQSRVLPALVGLGAGDARRLVEATTLEVEAEIDAALTAERRARARRRRRVWVSADPDGMGAITGTMAAEQLRRWTLDFEELVRAQKLADRDGMVERTADQRRADVFAELPSRQLALIQALQQGTVTELLPEPAEPVVAEPASTATDTEQAADVMPDPSEPLEPEPPGQEPSEPLDRLVGLSVEQLRVELVRLPVRNPQVINVHIPMTAVLEIDHRPGVLEGYGAVSAEHVRLMVPVSGLRQVWVDGRTGVPIAVSDQVHEPEPDPQRSRDRLLTLLGPHVVVHGTEPRHDPSDKLARSVQLRDQRCTGIGCERHAGGCDLDHEVRYPDGPTAYWNVSAKSRRCHRAKHAGWDVERHESGEVSWTSPLGRTYVRPGVWTPPRPLPFDLVLPEVRPHVHDDHDPHLVDPDCEEALLPDDSAAPQPETLGWDNEPPF